MENSFIAVLKAIVYGIVEGIAEWLPVSSTGHLIILNSFFGTEEAYGANFWEFFLVFIQLGAILAVIVIENYRYKKDMACCTLKEMNFYSKSHTDVIYEDVFDLDFKIVLIIGCAQVLSLIPGTSRSGVTILAALLLGCSRTCASKFSFYLSIPVMLGASLVKFMSFQKAGIAWNTNEIIYVVVGLIFAFLTSI